MKDILYNDEYADCKLDVYLPDSNSFSTVIWFHGGGLEAHGKDSKSAVEIADRFTKKGFAFVSADYRIYPNAKFPDFLHDGADVVRYVKNAIPKWGGNGEIILSGQSAGAWIALMLCFDPRYLNGVGIEPTEIRAWIIDSAQTTAHFNVLKYELGEDPNIQRINQFAPQYYVNENTAFSKILLIFYEKDIPCRYEQNMLFYKSILTLDQNADIDYRILSGSHCHGSTEKDEDGEYAYTKIAFAWMKERKIID